jgi:hypothetical protein
LRGPLRRHLMCAGASPLDADDAVQETFLRLCRQLVRRWLGTVCVMSGEVRAISEPCHSMTRWRSMAARIATATPSFVRWLRNASGA